VVIRQARSLRSATGAAVAVLLELCCPGIVHAQAWDSLPIAGEGQPWHRSCSTAPAEDWIPFNWRTVNRARMPWITPDRAKLMEMLHCSSLFLEKNNFITPLWPTHPLVRLAAWLYRPLARWRVEHLDDRWPLEIKLVERLGLCPKQE